MHYLAYVVPVKSKVEISQNFVAFSEYMNFINHKKLNSQLLTVQILTNDVQVLILFLSYSITTVKYKLIWQMN